MPYCPVPGSHICYVQGLGENGFLSRYRGWLDEAGLVIEKCWRKGQKITSGSAEQLRGETKSLSSGERGGMQVGTDRSHQV